MASRCKVTVKELGGKGVSHTVELGADSKMQAVGLALAELRAQVLGEPAPPLSEEFTVEVLAPVRSFTVRKSEFLAWLNTAAKSPAEQVTKANIRERLGIVE